MQRRDFIGLSVASSASIIHGTAEAQEAARSTLPTLPNQAVKGPQPLANSFVTLWKSPAPTKLTVGTPGMTRLPQGRLVATFQVNGKDAGLREDHWGPWRGRVLVSDDHGQTWRETTQFPMTGARPIAVGQRLFVIGLNAGICVIASDDGGESWSQPSRIRQNESWEWYSQACSIVLTEQRVFLSMDKVTTQDKPPSRGIYAPVVLSARVDSDWLQPEAWTLSNTLTYNEALRQNSISQIPGIPFYPPNKHLDKPRLGRIIQQPGWFESNVVQIVDPEHIWHDPQGRTLHIFMRSNTCGLANMAALAKAELSDDGTIQVSLEKTPAGTPLLLVPMPGGHNRFHITFDPQSKLYWLVSLQTTDSMRRVELLNPKRWNLPDNERHRLALHFSKNCIDWCFAGLIAKVDDDGQSRHYGPGVIDGNDLHVLSRSASAAADNAHEADLLTFHSVRNFRKLIY